MKFEDLVFAKWRKVPSYFNPMERLVLGKRAWASFTNGYTVSVILGNEDDDSYSNGIDTYEVAVFNTLTGDACESLIYLEDGICKYATKSLIDVILEDVESLPKATIERKQVEYKPVSEESLEEMIQQLLSLQASFAPLEKTLSEMVDKVKNKK